jgi:hypothetical protein
MLWYQLQPPNIFNIQSFKERERERERENTQCDGTLCRFLFTIKVQTILSETEWGGIPSGVWQRLVQPVGTLQIFHQDAHREIPAVGEAHRGPVRHAVSAPVCFGECIVSCAFSSRCTGLLTDQCALRQRLGECIVRCAFSSQNISLLTDHCALRRRLGKRRVH